MLRKAEAEVRENNTEEVVKGMKDAFMRSLESIGLMAEGDAKELCPVDTGRLQNSITHQVDESDNAVYIGTNVEYAVYVELDDNARHKTGQAHFLRDAARNHGDNYATIIKGELQNG